MTYFLLLPSGYTAGKRYPVLLWLHQLQNDSMVPNQPGQWVNTADYRSRYQNITVAPRCPNSNDQINWGGVTSGPTNCEKQALAIAKAVVAKYGDANSVYVSGASMGGI